MDKKFLTQLDVAARWDISHKTLEKWRWLSMGPRYVKFGSAVRYSMNEIEAFEESSLYNSTTDEYLKKSNLNK